MDLQPRAEHDGVGLQPTHFAAVGLPAPLADALRDDTLPGGQTQLSIGTHSQLLRGVITSLLELSSTTAPPSRRLASPIAPSARAASWTALPASSASGTAPHNPIQEPPRASLTSASRPPPTWGRSHHPWTSARSQG